VPLRLDPHWFTLADAFYKVAILGNNVDRSSLTPEHGTIWVLALLIAACGSQKPPESFGFPARLPAQITSATHGGDALDFSTEPVAIADGRIYLACDGSRILLDIGPGSGKWASYYHVYQSRFDDGALVKAGDVLADLARTRTDALGCDGFWTNPHLHFEIYEFRPASTDWDGISTASYTLGGWYQDPEATGRDGALLHAEHGRRTQWDFVEVADEMPETP